MDKSKALDAALSQIERAFGKGSIMKLGKNEQGDGRRDRLHRLALASTSRSASAACRAAAWSKSTARNPPARPRSRCTAVAEAQKKGGICAFIDAEHALDPIYARKLGVNIDDLLISQPDTGEQALEIADTLVRSGAIDVLVIDSVAALVPRAELEGEMGDMLPGLQARLMSQALRKLTGSINKSNTMVIFINQIRMKIGVMFGTPETTTGGNALKFYASVRLDIRRIGAIKEGDEVVGNRTRVKVVKNKLAPPFKQVEFDIMYGEGISKTGELVDLGVKAGVVEKSGAWFSYDSQRIGQGRENAKAFLKAQPDIASKIEAAIRGNAGLIAEKILPAERGRRRRRTTRPRRRKLARLAAERPRLPTGRAAHAMPGAPPHRAARREPSAAPPDRARIVCARRAPAQPNRLASAVPGRASPPPLHSRPETSIRPGI